MIHLQPHRGGHRAIRCWRFGSNRDCELQASNPVQIVMNSMFPGRLGRKMVGFCETKLGGK